MVNSMTASIRDLLDAVEELEHPPGQQGRGFGIVRRQ
jgi:hypothetical protein